MKWITREEVTVDRVAGAWLIKPFVDHDLVDDRALVLLGKSLMVQILIMT